MGRSRPKSPALFARDNNVVRQKFFEGRQPMQCERCGENFRETELHPPSTFLRILAFPFAWPFFLKSGVVRGEVFGRYCGPCRRQFNYCLFFVIAVPATLGLGYLMKYLGFIAPVPPRP